MKISKTKLREVKAIFFDFDGVFTDNKVLLCEDGKESVICSREDGMGIGLLEKIGLLKFIISSEVNPVVSTRAIKLQIPCEQAVKNKAQVIQKICKKNQITAKNIIYVGNDINDIDAFAIAGISIAVNDSHNDVFQHVDYVTKKNGGNGAVREICDLLYYSRKK